MPMQRFLLVEGIRDDNGCGHPVTDPHNPSASPARYAGWQFAPKMRNDGRGAEEVDGIIDHYKPVKQVIVAHVDLRAAIEKGHLKLHGECVARSHVDAEANFNNGAAHAKPAHKSSRGDK